MRARGTGMVIALLTLFSTSAVHAQDQQPDQPKPEGYPDWVTNDYECVIGCMQGFNGDMQERPNVELEKSSMDCVSNTCSKETFGLNVYQAQYIISMYYATGSIYECDGKPCNFTAENATGGENNVSPPTEGDATSSGSAENPTVAAVSMPGLSTAVYSAGASPPTSKPLSSSTSGTAIDNSTSNNGSTSAGHVVIDGNGSAVLALGWTVLAGLLGLLTLVGH